MKRWIYIVFTLITALPVQAVVRDVPCGDWITLEAHAAEDYHFVKWSDDNTDSIRQIQVHEDATYIAYFAANCEEYANWPVVALYDWLLMVNVRAIHEMGYYTSPDNVTWYRVVGEPDDMHDVFPQDDRVVCTGYYLTLDRNLKGSGDYYAVVDVSNAQGMLCDGLMRTVIIQYSDNHKAPRLALMPSIVLPNQTLKLTGMVPNETTAISIYSASGQLIRIMESYDATQLLFPAECTAGCYYVRVESSSVNQVLKYLVKK